MQIGPIAAILTILSFLAAAPALAQHNPVEAAAYAAEAAAMGEKCGWIGTGERDVLHLSRDERLAIVAMENAAAVEQAHAIVDQAAARGAAAACDGPNAETIRQEIGNAAFQQLAVWVARADAYLSYSINEAWAQDITTLNAQQHEIAAAAASFSASPDFAPLRARMLNEAQLILTAICPDRETERFVKGSRPCPPNSQPQVVPVARIILAGTEAIVPLYETIRARQEALLIASKPYDGQGGRAFLGSFEDSMLYQELDWARLDPGFMFNGEFFVDEWQTRNAIEAAMREQFNCQQPGRLVWHTASPDSISEEVEVRQTAQGDYVHYRVTAPVRRVGEVGTLGMLTVTYWDYRDIMASAMAGKVRQYAVEGGSGQAEAFRYMSLISCY